MWTNAARKTYLGSSSTGRRHKQGVALLTAISLVMLFVLLGTAYVRYATLDEEKATFDLRVLRAHQAAVNGIDATLAEVTAAIANGVAPQTEYQLEFPAYTINRHEVLGFGSNTNRRMAVTVTVTPESGKININHAPASVLRAILDIDAPTAEKIVNSLPKPSASATGNTEEAEWSGGGDRIWLFSLDDMVARGLIDAATAHKIDPETITFATEPDHAAPAAYFNPNDASTKALAAALGAGVDVAEKVTAARPIQDMTQLESAAGKPAAEFPLPAEAWCFTSRSFRFTSLGRYADIVYETGEEFRVSRCRVDATVVIDATGAPSFRIWTESTGWLAPGQKEESPEPAPNAG